MAVLTANVTVGATNALAQAIARQLQPRVLRAADRLGQDGITRVVQRASAIYNVRAPGRSRSASILSPSSYRYQVTPTSTGASVRWSPAQTGSLFMAKFFALNNGTRSHEIRKRGGGLLRYPPVEPGPPYIYTHRVFWRERGGKFGTHFYERGIGDAVRAFRVT